MSVPYELNIPDGPNNPSQDQPKMKINTNAVNTILATDHVSFNTASGGTHKQVTLSSKNVPVAQTDPQSIIYSDSGSASSVSELLYKNQNGIFPLSCIRAFCSFSTQAGNGTITPSNGYNIDPVSKVLKTGSVYDVNLVAGAMTGTSACVLISSGTLFSSGSQSLNFGYTVSADKISITVSGSGITVPGLVSMLVLQA